MNFIFNWCMNIFLSFFLLLMAPSLQAQIVVSTFAGSGTAGYVDATGAAAVFNSPIGIATDADGNIYVADANNNKIRKISLSGVVTTLAGSTAGDVDANGTSARFNTPVGIAVDAYRNVYVADYLNHKIRKISPSGDVSTFAGTGSPGNANGPGNGASFNNPRGLAIDVHGNVYVADFGNNLIRKITALGDVSTLAGSGIAGSVNATGTAASFNIPYGITVDAHGIVYVGDYGNNKIRKIDLLGAVSTLAGSGVVGDADSTGIKASFNAPTGILVDTAGNVYVADSGNNKIRKISQSGAVSTFAGTGPVGSTNGIVSSARFYSPTGLAVDPYGNIYVADVGNHKIRLITFSPEIRISQSGSELISGLGTYNFGSFDQFLSSMPIPFDINNLTTGLGALVLKSSPYITISGANALDFTVDESTTDGSIEPDSSTRFTITFSPKSSGIRTATVTVINNDYDEGSYTFTITGTGTGIFTGITTASTLSLSVHPNPTSGIVEVDAPKEVQLEVYNAQGIKVLEQTVPEGKSNVSLEQLNQGLYLIYYREGNAKSETYRIIKN